MVSSKCIFSFRTFTSLNSSCLIIAGRELDAIPTTPSNTVLCSDCKVSLPGIKHIRSSKYHATKKRERTVSRAYGGSCCASCVKGRIMRAFLLEEQKAVKKVLAERAGK
ncbi:unnamed protein product [Cylindrotheca closterium]|uniref:60S ribosomal protein L34 n=1 Tax=Cylindrotheca closterium TaxID=2856 RepID=A0AAD2JHV9_9STRA|nr:unnamed protein product [Cylindrotheca closterium]